MARADTTPSGLLRGEVTCILCARAVATIHGPASRHFEPSWLRALDPEHADTVRRLRCPFCAGGLYPQRLEHVREDAPMPRHAAERADKTVLIVDDNTTVRRICSMILRREGFRVLEATNGRDAVTRYGERRPDVVLLAPKMPEMDGQAALAGILELDPAARVIVVTDGSEAEVRHALELGARGFVRKPLTRTHVVSAVWGLLSSGADRPVVVHGFSQTAAEHRGLAPGVAVAGGVTQRALHAGPDVYPTKPLKPSEPLMIVDRLVA